MIVIVVIRNIIMYGDCVISHKWQKSDLRLNEEISDGFHLIPQNVC